MPNQPPKSIPLKQTMNIPAIHTMRRKGFSSDGQGTSMSVSGGKKNVKPRK